MGSPFPGFDPYLKLYWPGVRTTLVVYAADFLNERLAQGLVARIDGREVADGEIERFINIANIDEQ